MTLTNVISVALLCFVLFIGASRILVLIKLKKISAAAVSSPTFQRKLDYVKHRQQKRHVSALLLISICLALGMIVATYNLFQLQVQLNDLTKQIKSTQKNLSLVKKEQQKISYKFPIKNYPESGVGLAKYDWNGLFSADNRQQQYTTEHEISNSLSAYFGLPTTLIVLDIPTQTLNIALAGEWVNAENERQIKANLSAFAKEAEAIAQLTQITFQLNVSDGKKQSQKYRCLFSRENSDEQFLMVQEE